jgi:transposase
MIIGIDPHKLSHTATAMDPATNTAASSLRVGASLAGYRELLGWARQFPDRRWAVENAKGLGCHLAQWLVARGEAVVDVATTATSRVRELTRGGRRKNDVIDASAAASVAALQGDAQVVDAADETTVFAVLEERRANLAAQRVRCVNQLHAVMRDLVAGGVRAALTAKAAGEALRKVRPTTRTERIRKIIAWDLVRDVRNLDRQLNTIAAQMTETLDGYDNQLLEIDGVGPVLAVRLIGRTGRPSRFRSSDAFASYTGVAPIEVSSGQRSTHRLSRSGDRRLNSTLHLIAVTQVRMRDSAGHRYFERKIEQGKTRNEAMRCLKRKIASHVWRRMLAAELRRQHHVALPEAA